MIGRPTHTALHASEEAFCRDVDKLLIGRLQTHAESEEAKERLANVAKLTDRKLISQLAKLAVTPEGLMAVQMVPLILIAWSNGNVDKKERRFVMAKAKRFGVAERSEAFALLEHWLGHRPPVLVLDTWKRFIRHELASMCPKSRARLIEMTKEQMLSVARCSGGFLGLRRISASKHKLIAAMSKVLDETFNEADMTRHAG